MRCGAVRSPHRRITKRKRTAPHREIIKKKTAPHRTVKCGGNKCCSLRSTWLELALTPCICWHAAVQLFAFKHECSYLLQIDEMGWCPVPCLLGRCWFILPGEGYELEVQSTSDIYHKQYVRISRLWLCCTSLHQDSFRRIYATLRAAQLGQILVNLRSTQRELNQGLSSILTLVCGNQRNYSRRRHS